MQNRIVQSLFYVLMFVLIISGCDTYTPLEYMKNIENGDIYKYSDKRNDIYMNVYYRPKAYLILREMLKEGNNIDHISEEEYKKRKETFTEGYYFDIRIGRKDVKKNIVIAGLQSRSSYNKRIQYLTYEFKRDIYLQTDEGGIVYPISYDFYNTYGKGRTANFTFIFPKDPLKGIETAKLIYKDKVFGCSQKLSVNISIDNLNQTTDINFQQN